MTVMLPILLFVLVAAAVSCAMIAAPRLLAPRKRTAVKEMPYESGMDPIHDARRRFAVRFHLVAIAFLVFDVEMLFLYPWAVATRKRRGHFKRRSARWFPAAGWFSAGRWCSFCWWWWVSFTTGEKGFSNGGRTARKRRRQQARRAGQLVPQEQPVADAVRHRLLRHRVDGHRREQARYRPLRRRSVSLQPAAVRFDDRRRPRGDENVAGAAAHLAADERAEVVHFDGGLRQHRRRVRHLLRGAGDRSFHSGRHVRARLPAAAGAIDSIDHRPARQNSARRHAAAAANSPPPRGSSRSGHWSS